MGELIVSSGGFVEEVEAYSGGVLSVVDEGSANSVIIYSSGYVYIDSGGSCSLVDVSNGGSLCIWDSGVVDNVNIYAGGVVEIDESGAAYDVKESGGQIEFDPEYTTVNITEQTVDNGIDVYVTDTISATATVHSGTTFQSANIHENASARIYSSGYVGIMNLYGSATISASGCIKTLRVIGSNASAAILTDAIIPPSGEIWVYSGGCASGYQPVQINSGVVVQVSIEPRDDFGNDARSGSVYNFAINPHGSFIVASGGYADDIIENGGYVELQAGATCDFTPNTMSVSLEGDPRSNTFDICTVHSGTTLSRATLKNNAAIFIFSGGSASNVSLCTSTCGIWWVDTNTDDYRENGDYASATSVVYGAPGIYKVLTNGTISKTGNIT